MCCADAAGSCKTFFEDTAQPACLPANASFASSAELEELLSNFEAFGCYHNVTNQPQSAIRKSKRPTVPGLEVNPCETLREAYYAGLGCAECAEAPNAAASSPGRDCLIWTTLETCESDANFNVRNCTLTLGETSSGAWGADFHAVGFSAVVGLLSYVLFA